jgi:hypothetical protein
MLKGEALALLLLLAAPVGVAFDEVFDNRAVLLRQGAEPLAVVPDARGEGVRLALVVFKEGRELLHVRCANVTCSTRNWHF